MPILSKKDRFIKNRFFLLINPQYQKVQNFFNQVHYYLFYNYLKRNFIFFILKVIWFSSSLVSFPNSTNFVKIVLLISIWKAINWKRFSFVFLRYSAFSNAFFSNTLSVPHLGSFKIFLSLEALSNNIKRNLLMSTTGYFEILRESLVSGAKKLMVYYLIIII